MCVCVCVRHVLHEHTPIRLCGLLNENPFWYEEEWNGKIFVRTGRGEIVRAVRHVGLKAPFTRAFDCCIRDIVNACNTQRCCTVISNNIPRIIYGVAQNAEAVFNNIQKYSPSAFAILLSSEYFRLRCYDLSKPFVSRILYACTPCSFIKAPTRPTDNDINFSIKRVQRYSGDFRFSMRE